MVEDAIKDQQKRMKLLNSTEESKRPTLSKDFPVFEGITTLNLDAAEVK
jgi:hypothetical protein